MQKFNEALIALSKADIFVIEAVPKGGRIDLGIIPACLLIIECEGIGVLCVNVSGVLSPISVFVATSMRTLLF
jgi:hypothetical protein